MNRRSLLAALAVAPIAAACASKFPEPERGPFTVLFPGSPADGDFHSMVLDAVTREQLLRSIQIEVRSCEELSSDAIADALRRIAREKPAVVFCIGSAMAIPLQRVAWEFPAQDFTLLQGRLVRPNVAAYALREEEPAWLAGFLAARLSKSRAIGIVNSPVPFRPERLTAAYRAGARRASEAIRVVEASSALDPVEAVQALAESRADVVYAAVDAAPNEAIDACRNRGLAFIGQWRDWSALAPDTVVASCLGDPGALFSAAVQDIVDAVWRGDYVRTFGMRYPRMLGFSLAAATPPSLVAEMSEVATDVASGRVAAAQL